MAVADPVLPEHGEHTNMNTAMIPVYGFFIAIFLLYVSKIVAIELTRDLNYGFARLLTALGFAKTIHDPENDNQPAYQKAPTEAETLRYFDKSFSRTNHLMQGMACYNFLLSGSRALDVFLPGSASRDSDWDFYIHNNQQCIDGALKTLANCGVVWEDVFTPLKRLLAAKEGEVLHLTRDMAERYVLRSWSFEASKRDELGVKTDRALAGLITMMNKATKELSQNFEQKLKQATADTKVAVERSALQVTVHVNHAQVCIHRTRNEQNSDFFAGVNYGPSVNIVRGYTTWNGTRQTVQLISAPRKSPIDLIMAFYASHVQCFISGFGAAHLYHQAAMGHKAWAWSDNTQHRVTAETAKAKYESRGFKFMERSASSNERKLRTLETFAGATLKIFEFDFSLGIRTQLEAVQKQALKKLAWIETSNRTWHVPDAEVVRNHERWVRNAAQLVTPDDEGNTGRAYNVDTHLHDQCVIFKTDSRRIPENMVLF